MIKRSRMKLYNFVFFVIWQHQHPYISAMVNNGTLTYDHDRDGTLTQIAGCEAKFRNVDHDTHISIQYINNKLIVRTDLENKNEWKLCFESKNVLLPTGYYLGASATTGDLSDNHDIISFKFYELEPLADVSVDRFWSGDSIFVEIPCYHCLTNLKVLNVYRICTRWTDRNLFFVFQHATLMDRMHIVPQAEAVEPPRERKDDLKPGMSNIKVLYQRQNQFRVSTFPCYWFFPFFSYSDFLLDFVRNDLRHCAGRIGHYVVSKTQGVVEKIVVIEWYYVIYAYCMYKIATTSLKKWSQIEFWWNVEIASKRKKLLINYYWMRIGFLYCSYNPD